MLSQTVANALDLYGKSETTETKKFVEIFNKFFDCLNVRSLEEHRRKKNPNLKPYRSATDERLEVSTCHTHTHTHTQTVRGQGECTTIILYKNNL